MNAKKNYTSTVPPERTAQRIEDFLIRAGVTNITKQYEAGQIVGFEFMVLTDFGLMLFRMPIDTEAACKVLLGQRKRYTTEREKKTVREQAARMAWKLMQDWIEVELTRVTFKQVSLEQALFPYAVNKDDKPMFQVFREQRMALLQAPKDAPEVADGEVSP